MLNKRSFPVLVGLIALVGVLAVTSFGDDPADAAPLAANGFDLAAALDNAAEGDTITLDADTVLSRDTTVRSGVTLDDGGFSLKIPTHSTLNVEGMFTSSGNLKIDPQGSVVVAAGGLLRIDNEGKTAEVSGTIEICKEGAASVGSIVKGSVECFSTGRLLIGGTMTVGCDSLFSTVTARNAVVTGELQVSLGSTFKIQNSLTIGNSPTLTTDMENPAVISGRITLESTAYVLVYGQPPSGQSGFTSENLSHPSLQTRFMAFEKVYATEYKANPGNRTLVIPSTSDLIDWRLVKWEDSAGNVVTDTNSLQIGSEGNKTIKGTFEKKTYRIVFAEDKSIRWVVGPKVLGSSGEIEEVYGAKLIISIRAAPGNTELPTIFMDGAPFALGTTFTVTGETTFTTSNNYLAKDDSLVPTLVIILAILLVILGISYTMLRMKEKKKAE